jgi:hypothetical protein
VFPNFDIQGEFSGKGDEFDFQSVFRGETAEESTICVGQVHYRILRDEAGDG